MIPPEHSKDDTFDFQYQPLKTEKPLLGTQYPIMKLCVVCIVVLEGRNNWNSSRKEKESTVCRSIPMNES